MDYTSTSGNTERRNAPPDGNNRGPSNIGHSKWKMFKSRSTGLCYWIKGGDPKTSQWEPPTDPESVLFRGTALDCRDNVLFSVARLSPYDRKDMWKRWARSFAKPMDPGFPDEISNTDAHDLNKLTDFIHFAFNRIPKTICNLWNNEMDCFILDAPLPQQLSEQSLPKIPERTSISSKDQWEAPELLPNESIKNIYKNRQVSTLYGKMKVSSAVCPLEGMHLYRLVYENQFSRTMEVGMACGLSALYICQALSDIDKTGNAKSGRKHVSIDPFQRTQWGSAAIVELQNAGLQDYSKHVEGYAHSAIPKMEEQGDCFDLIFVDGMHLFDYTLVDLFLSDKVLKVGGILVLDDIKHPAVAESLQYIRKNYSHWQLVSESGCSETSATFIKTNADLRKWNAHQSMHGETIGANKRGRAS